MGPGWKPRFFTAKRDLVEAGTEYLIGHSLEPEYVAKRLRLPKDYSSKKARELTLEDLMWADIFFGWPLGAPSLARRLRWVHLPSAGADGYRIPQLCP